MRRYTKSIFKNFIANLQQSKGKKEKYITLFFPLWLLMFMFSQKDAYPQELNFCQKFRVFSAILRIPIKDMLPHYLFESWISVWWTQSDDEFLCMKIKILYDDGKIWHRLSKLGIYYACREN